MTSEEIQVASRPMARVLRSWWFRGPTIVLCLGALCLGVGAFVYTVRAPEHRIDFLLDASTTDAAHDQPGLRDAVTALTGAVSNTGDRDALALRRFGGSCGAVDTSDLLVPSKVGQGSRIIEAARRVQPAGQATLDAGISAAIKDFSTWFPPRGRRTNELVVVTRHGSDACQRGPGNLRDVQQFAHRTGVDLRLRIVGYQVPPEERTALVSAVNASSTRSTPMDVQFVNDPVGLQRLLKHIVVPRLPEAVPVEVKPPPTLLGDQWVDGQQPDYAVRFTSAGLGGKALKGTFGTYVRELAPGGCLKYAAFRDDLRVTEVYQRPAYVPASAPADSTYYVGTARICDAFGKKSTVGVQLSVAEKSGIICRKRGDCRSMTRVTPLPGWTWERAMSTRWWNVLASSIRDCDPSFWKDRKLQKAMPDPTESKLLKDLNGDGYADIVVQARCITGASTWPQHTVVFDGRSGPSHPTVLLNVGRRSDEIIDNGEVYLQEKSLTVAGTTWGPHDAGCCPSWWLSVTYRWNGSSFIRSTRERDSSIPDI